MVSFDRSKSTFIDNKVKERVEKERTGKVIRVYEHDSGPDTSNFEADVVVDGGTRGQSSASIATATADTISVPKVGDTVLIQYMAGETDKPIITGFVHTTRDRASLGKAGMDRKKIDSGQKKKTDDNGDIIQEEVSSPAGTGDVYTTEYTSYNGDPSIENVNELQPAETFVQIAKRSDEVADPTDEDALPAKVEFYDAPAKDEAHITVELNKRDSADSDATWGMKFNLKTGEVKLVDPSGYGLKSDGDGNWVWEYESKTENQVSGGGSLSL